MAKCQNQSNMDFFSIDCLMQVAIAVVLHNNCILISHRQKTKNYNALYEFPGGQVESGENIQQALKRELTEETGLIAENSRFLYTYKSDQLTLSFFLVTAFSGQLSNPEGQLWWWQPTHLIDKKAFPTANQKVFQWLGL